MKWEIRLVFIFQVLSVVFGIYNEVAPTHFPFRYLPPGMGVAIALIAGTMMVALLVIDKERERIAEQTKGSALWDRVSSRLTMTLAAHERDFYSLWEVQVHTAKNNIDVTHLGPRPPQNCHGKEEKEYFKNLKKLYKSSSAHIRRVERLTTEKLPWIRKLVSDFSGLENVSLAIYKDPLGGEMPAALSVCRVDDRYAWIIAIAEHESTSNYRDLLLTGPESVDLIRRYFQERLWNRSTVVINRGEVIADWEQGLFK